MSQYIVSARKYRPKNFNEVVGQQHVATTLQLALSNDHLAHAFLFTGPRGVGKTSCARILAKLINCENPIDKKDPCDECSSCRTFNENSSFNIIELDGASNNKVEHIRTMIQQVRIAPQNGRYKVFIIDEVHMLTTQAFNAFLKTLEEPPPYAIFILATTEKHKIIPTILSRCQVFDFKRIQVPEIVTQLEKICEIEGITPEKEALTVIGQKADGAMRDALSIYDRIVGSLTDTLTYKDVITNLNLLDYDYFFEMTDSLVKEDLSEVFLLFDKVLKQGFDPSQFIAGLSQHFRELLVSKDPRTIVLLEYSDKLKKRYYDQSQLCTKKFLLTGLNILNQCDINLVRAKNKNLHTEIALSKITYIGRVSEMIPNDQEKKKLVLQVKPSNESSIAKSSNPIIETIKDDKPLVSSTSTDTIAVKGEASFSEKKSKSEIQKEVEVPNSEENKSKEDSSKKEGSSVTSKVMTSTVKKIISAPSLDIDNLLNQIDKTNQEKEAAKKEVTIEAIDEIWKEHIEKTTSEAVKACLGMAKYKLEGTDKLVVYTPNNISKSDILSEKSLLEQMRLDFLIPNFAMEIVVDIEQFPGMEAPKAKKVFSNKEKYDNIIEQNPMVADFIQKFHLKLKN